MSTGALVILLVALLAAGTLLAARIGIRSIQRARKVVFYRTRRAYMLAGWQWLVLALVLFSSTVASALFGEPIAQQLIPAAPSAIIGLPTETFTSSLADLDLPTASPTTAPTEMTNQVFSPTATKTRSTSIILSPQGTPSSTPT
ncbi:MAG TPA: hypothetical protein VK249_05250, partial [Anaerolineales bacterium]|nr:hypothetical protein [Anaerolineales bacterium]